MKRMHQIEQSVGFVDLPDDVLFYIKQFFFHVKKKKNSVDVKGFEQLYSLALVNMRFYRLFVNDLVPILTMQCANENCLQGLGRYSCEKTKCTNYGTEKLCKRCCYKCALCGQRFCGSDADMEECCCCRDRYCNDECAIIGFPYCCGGSGYQGEICRHCYRHSSNSSNEEEEEEEISMESDRSYDSPLSSFYTDSEVDEKTDDNDLDESDDSPLLFK